MSYTGAINGPPVNVVGVHRNDNVSHYLVDGQCEFIKIAVQLIDVGVVIVGRVCELLQATKLYDCHRHKPVSKNTTVRMRVEGSPRQKSALYCGKFTLFGDYFALHAMGDRDIRNAILTSRRGDAPEWQSFSSPCLCQPCSVETISWRGTKMKIKDLKITVLQFLDVACSGSKSRMRLFPCSGAFYTMFFPCF